MSEVRKRSRKTFGLEVVLAIILLVIGVSYGVFELWLHKFANKGLLRDLADECYYDERYFMAKFFALLSVRKGDNYGELKLAIINFKQNDIEGALYWAKKIEKPEIKEAKVLIALCYEKQGKYLEAIKKFAQNSAHNHNFVWEILYYNREDLGLEREKAIAEYQKLANAGNKDACALVAMGQRGEGYNKDALKYYLKAYQLGAKWTAEFICFCYNEEKNFTKAIEWAKIVYNGGERRFASYIARLYREVKNYEEALKWYKKALSFAPVLYFGDIAELNLKLRHYDEAILWYKKALAQKSDEIDKFRLKLAEIYKLKGNNIAYIEWLKKAAKEECTYAAYLLGQEFQAQKRYDEAVKYYKLILNEKGFYFEGCDLSSIEKVKNIDYKFWLNTDFKIHSKLALEKLIEIAKIQKNNADLKKYQQQLAKIEHTNQK